MNPRNMTTRELEAIVDELYRTIKNEDYHPSKHREIMEDYTYYGEALEARLREERDNTRNSYYSRGDNQDSNRGEKTMSAGSIFSRDDSRDSREDFTYRRKGGDTVRKHVPPIEDDEPVREYKKESVNKPIAFSPKYPFILAKNLKETTDKKYVGTIEKISEIITPNQIQKKRDILGNVDAIEFEFIKSDVPYEISPNLTRSPVDYKAFVAPIADIIIPKSSVSKLDLKEDISLKNYPYKKERDIDKYLYSQIGQDIKYLLNSLEIYVEFSDLSVIPEILSSELIKGEYLKDFSKALLSMKFSEVDETTVKFELNRKTIYLDSPDVYIPTDDKIFFVNEVSNETLYSALNYIKQEYKSYFGILEGIDYKFNYYIGKDKILLVRA